jgi:hypothetical protein
MCIYIHVYVYIHICIYMYIQIDVYLYMNLYVAITSTAPARKSAFCCCLGTPPYIHTLFKPPTSDDDDVYLDKLQTRCVKKSILITFKR